VLQVLLLLLKLVVVVVVVMQEVNAGGLGLVDTFGRESI
jgi:preprotein translocase subunit SecG